VMARPADSTDKTEKACSREVLNQSAGENNVLTQKLAVMDDAADAAATIAAQGALSPAIPREFGEPSQDTVPLNPSRILVRI
jgi:hypothetical protein